MKLCNLLAFKNPRHIIKHLLGYTS